jgi:hypothetical protein
MEKLCQLTIDRAAFVVTVIVLPTVLIPAIPLVACGPVGSTCAYVAPAPAPRLHATATAAAAGFSEKKDCRAPRALFERLVPAMENPLFPSPAAI